MRITSPGVQRAFGGLELASAVFCLVTAVVFPQARVAAVLFSLPFFVTGFTSQRLLVEASAEGVVVRNHFSRYRYLWTSVVGFEIQRLRGGINVPSSLGLPGTVIVLVTASGGRVPMAATQDVGDAGSVQHERLAALQQLMQDHQEALG